MTESTHSYFCTKCGTITESDAYHESVLCSKPGCNYFVPRSPELTVEGVALMFDTMGYQQNDHCVSVCCSYVSAPLRKRVYSISLAYAPGNGTARKVYSTPVVVGLGEAVALFLGEAPSPQSLKG